ncbi:hypothetical protein BDV25DRAFT_169113 [Aspergillus avenaceus]|uniref:ML-like domain-containing protein n=1 Tax=Aspergillus avenaceus TaxID=36643 RepID=A0A5N6TM43_ASPAV|nr:hypothetical protein BDV25DRAFT_169113 [Aspergillus avenaceus]
MRPHTLFAYFLVLFTLPLALGENYIESRALNLCSNSLEFTATYFNVKFTPQNRSIALSLNGRSTISGKVIAELIITVYGYTAMRRVLNPCDMDLAGLCPVRPGPIPVMSSNIKIPDSVVAQIPGIAYSVPDLDASVRVWINSTDTGRSITCIEAALSNGKTVHQPGVSWTTAGISGLGLAASAATSVLGHSKTATHIAANVLSLFGFMQSQAMIGMSAVHMPPIVQSWTQNFQWSMGIIHVKFLERLCTWYQRSTGGRPSTVLSDRFKKSIQILKRHLEDILVKKSEDTTKSEHHSIVVRGIQRVGYREGIEISNIFMTGLIFFLVFALLAMICIALTKVCHKILVKSGKLKGDGIRWGLVTKGVLFRVILIGFPQIWILCVWEFTQRNSAAQVLLAAIMLIATTTAMAFAAHKVISLAKQSVTLCKNPAYILYTDPACLSKWGFLYEQYQAKAYWFITPALSYIVIKAMFIGLGQPAPIVQTIALVIIEASMLLTVSILRPWMNKKTDIYNISIAVVNLINAIFLLIFTNIFSQPGILTGVMGVVFFAYNAVFSLVMLILILVASICALLSKNPDNRYQPMRDDRGSFIRSQNQLITELDALGATARGPDKQSGQNGSSLSVVDTAQVHLFRQSPVEATPHASQSSIIRDNGDAILRQPSRNRNDIEQSPFEPPRSYSTSPAHADATLPTEFHSGHSKQNPWQRGAGYDRNMI